MVVNSVTERFIYPLSYITRRGIFIVEMRHCDKETYTNIHYTLSEVKVWLVSGEKYYRYTKGKGVDNGYPRPLSVWDGLPKRVDTAFQYTNEKTYFFAGPHYYRFVDHTFRVRQHHLFWIINESDG